MKFNVLLKLLSLTSLVIIWGQCLAEDERPEVTLDGLYLVSESDLARVFKLPGINPGQYNRIYLDETYVAFKKKWPGGQNSSDSSSVSANDMARIKVELSSLFREVFSRTLEDGGYELVTERAEDVLLVKPAIINLDMIATGSAADSNVRSYKETAGEMTLYLELYDSVSDAIIAKAVDRKTDRQTGYFKWQNRLSNRAAAHRILQVWADVLKQGLDAAGAVNKNKSPLVL